METSVYIEGVFFFCLGTPGAAGAAGSAGAAGAGGPAGNESNHDEHESNYTYYEFRFMMTHFVCFIDIIRFGRSTWPTRPRYVYF